MIRLLNKLGSLPEKADSIQHIYDGDYKLPMNTPANPTDKDEIEYDPTYWLDDGCFLQITESDPEQPMLATVVMGIPAERLGIFYDLRNEDDNLKRLKNILLNMRENDEKYDEMYDGTCKVVYPGGETAELVSDPIYWRENVFYSITKTARQKLGCPTVTIGIPADSLGIAADDFVVADYCLRELKPYMDELNDELYNRSRPVEENGWYYFCEPGGEVLVRNSAYFSVRMPRDYDYGSGINIYPWVDREVPEKLYLCLMIQVQLPHHKMKKTIRMLTSDLPKTIDRYIRNFDRKMLAKVIELSAKQHAIRSFLKDSEYCAFIANGSMLPRSKGSDLPMTDGIPFRSPPEDETEICGVRGMGIKRGVTVITGGGYSGKSTLIDAISAGIYNHALGDGRELCITDETAVTVSAEDGRAVSHVNISPFIREIPGCDSLDFSTGRASGSTSQAANIMEAMECGARLLLIDEDRSATNFMIRDPVMRCLIADEPITPFTERVGELAGRGVSTVLVIGGSGEYLSLADRVYIMEGYEPKDVTEHSKELAKGKTSDEKASEPADWSQRKIYLSEGFDSHPNGLGKERLQAIDLGILMIGAEDVDLRSLHDIVNPRQLHALGFILRAAMAKNFVNMFTNPKDPIDLPALIDEIYDGIASEGLDSVFSTSFPGMSRFLDLPRKSEVLLVTARMRSLTSKKA